MRHLDAIATLLRVADEKSSLIGVTTSQTAGSIRSLGQTVDDITAELNRLRDGLGGEGGLKPHQVDQVRTGLEGLLERVTAVNVGLRGVHSTLLDQAGQLEQFGRGETLMTDAMREELARTPAPTPAPPPPNAPQASSSGPGQQAPDAGQSEPAKEPEPAISER